MLRTTGPMSYDKRYMFCVRFEYYDGMVNEKMICGKNIAIFDHIPNDAEMYEIILKCSGAWKLSYNDFVEKKNYFMITDNAIYTLSGDGYSVQFSLVKLNNLENNLYDLLIILGD